MIVMNVIIFLSWKFSSCIVNIDSREQKRWSCQFLFCNPFILYFKDHTLIMTTKFPSKRVWNSEDTEKLYDSFRTKAADPEDQTPNHIKSFYTRTPWIQSIYKRPHSFYRTYRHHANVFIAEELDHGNRKGEIHNIKYLYILL